MLGCHDFCGHYDWTFHHVRQRFGDDALRNLWRDSIGGDSQRHYAENGAARGLRGLYETWIQTGEDEQCDWSFRLDEERNVVRWDMRRCPSKGFLLDNDLHTDEDYCDHCMGWMVPLLDSIGVEVTVHEHNHCGQCWGEMRVREGVRTPLTVEHDIRKDPRWERGHVERWESSVKLPVLPNASASSDPVEALAARFQHVTRILVLGRGPSARGAKVREGGADAVFVTGPTYATRDVFDGEPEAVLLGDRPSEAVLDGIAERYAVTPQVRRPLLMHVYLPSLPSPQWAKLGLPRPVTILPTLLRAGLYAHRPHQPYPTTGVFLLLLAVALGKEVEAAGIDLYASEQGHTWPDRHSRECELRHLRLARSRAGERLTLSSALQQILATASA